jgi:hypothetical protein
MFWEKIWKNMEVYMDDIYYPEWLANVVLVKKSNCKWRVCVVFIDMNKACPKDSYTLP